ncbi:hypothetical protein Plhal304r1_c028g0092951 [Plasmopara halstedii]
MMSLGYPHMRQVHYYNTCYTKASYNTIPLCFSQYEAASVGQPRILFLLRELVVKAGIKAAINLQQAATVWSKTIRAAIVDIGFVQPC